MEATKRCRRCELEKDVEHFAWRDRARGRRASYCRLCQKELMRAHYLANRDLYIERARRRARDERLARTRALLAYFDEHPCADCGEGDPVVLDFDHLGDKSFDVGQMLVQRPWAQVLAEIEKCDVVCANCHRRRTAERRPTVRLLLSRAADADGEPAEGDGSGPGPPSTDADD